MAKETDPMVYIQSKLNAPKNQRNNFGNYNYRSCEDILEAVKPLLADVECVLNVSDEIVQVANRIYVKATAKLTTKDGKTYETSAFAREQESKKGLDEAQITGAASSYARKYALNGLFCIDDNKDTDAYNNGKDSAPALKITDKEIALMAVRESKSESDLMRVWTGCSDSIRKDIKEAFTSRKLEMQKGK